MAINRRLGHGLAIIALTLSGAVADAADCSAEDNSKSSQVEQKIALLQRLVEDSEPLRRAERSGDPQALESIANARQALSGARKALQEGCVADASELSARGFKLMTTAFRSSGPSSRQVRDKFDAAMQQATTFMLALESQPKELLGLSHDDLKGLERQIDRAESLASDGAFEDALQLLLPVTDRLQRRLLEILNNKTVFYEKNFATPADEYSYLQEQYDGYLLLLQSGQKTTSYSAQSRVESLLKKASLLREEADASAHAERWQDALASMQAALEDCERAIRATGYTY